MEEEASAASSSSNERGNNDNNSTKESTTIGNKCDRELLKHVMDVIQEIKNAKRQCHVHSINEQLKEKYRDIYPRVRQLSDKDLMRELDMAVKEGILSKKFRQSNAADSTPQSTSPSSTAASISYRLPRLETLNDDKQDERDKKDSSNLIQLIIKATASLNKQNFQMPDRSPEKAESKSESNMCTIEELVKFMTKRNKLVLSKS
jgi:hypothetical protein